MREIKFRAWDKHEKQFIYMGTQFWFRQGELIHNFWDVSNVDEHYDIQQFTGLKDKNGLTKIYEGDIIDENGLVKGNIYEINEMDKRETDTVIQGFGTKTWCETVSRAILLGCKYSE